jgi:hypothetical protein
MCLVQPSAIREPIGLVYVPWLTQIFIALDALPSQVLRPRDHHRVESKELLGASRWSGRGRLNLLAFMADQRAWRYVVGLR